MDIFGTLIKLIISFAIVFQAHSSQKNKKFKNFYKKIMNGIENHSERMKIWKFLYLHIYLSKFQNLTKKQNDLFVIYNLLNEVFSLLFFFYYSHRLFCNNICNIFSV